MDVSSILARFYEILFWEFQDLAGTESLAQPK